MPKPPGCDICHALIHLDLPLVPLAEASLNPNPPSPQPLPQSSLPTHITTYCQRRWTLFLQTKPIIASLELHPTNNPIALFHLTKPSTQSFVLVMAQNFVSTARVGRDNQRVSLSGKRPRQPCLSKMVADMMFLTGYGAQGERLVAGVVPLSTDKKKVLLIQSTRRKGWVLPKGGWETDEKTPEEAACREAWEEAGVICKIKRDLGKIPDKRPPQQVTTEAPKAIFQFFEVTVEKEESKWPEMHKRGRKWMSYAEAKEALAARPELLDALNRSSVVR